jgi:phosphatidylglycerophosphate synthase
MATDRSTPAGTLLTRAVLLLGGIVTIAAAWFIVSRRADPAAVCAASSAVLLLLGGHRANHGDGVPFDRMLDALLDRVWDGSVLGAIAWSAHGTAPGVAAGALIALGASYLSSYIRARGASLGYTVEESHLTRGVRYGLVVYGLAFDRLGWTLWAVAGISMLAVIVRTTQVAKEERA